MWWRPDRTTSATDCESRTRGFRRIASPTTLPLLAARASRTRKGIIGRNGVIAAAAHIDAGASCRAACCALRALPLGSPEAAAIAEAGMQQPIRAERDVAAVVIGEGLRESSRRIDSLPASSPAPERVKREMRDSSTDPETCGLAVYERYTRPFEAYDGSNAMRQQDPPRRHCDHTAADIDERRDRRRTVRVVERLHHAALLDDVPLRRIARRLQ